MKSIIKNRCTLLILLALLAGCAGTGGFQEDDAGEEFGEFDSETSFEEEDEGVDVLPLDEDCKPPCEFTRGALEDPDSPLAERLIFFEFDKSEIQPQYQELLVNHGKYLASYPDVVIRLEGHADERGSREYNLALGELRAKAVRQVLLLQGVPAENINVVSFGEEIPLDDGQNEEAWAQNRRVELVYEEN